MVTQPQHCRLAWILAGLALIWASFLRSQGGAEPIKVEEKTVEFKGVKSKNGWTYYGGSFWLNTMQAAPKGDVVWMGGPTGLFRYDLKTSALERWTTLDGLIDNTVYDVALDKKGNVWAGTMSGVSRFDGQTFRSWDQKAIGHNAFGSIAIDTDGRTWVGCTGRYRLGAFCLPPGGEWIQYSAWALHENGGFLNDVCDIQPDPRGGTWLCGTYGGLMALEGSYQYHKPWGPNLYYMDLYGTANLVKLPTKDKDPYWPYYLALDGDQNLYVLCAADHRGTTNTTLFRLVIKKWFTHERKPIPDVTDIEWEDVSAPTGLEGKILAVHTDQEGSVWVATSEGIGRLTAEGYTQSIPLPYPAPRQHYSKNALEFVVLSGGAEALCFYVRRNGFFHWKDGVWTHLDVPLDGPVRGGRGFPIIGSTGRGPDGKLYFVRNTTTIFDGKSWEAQERRTGFVRDKHDRVHALWWLDPETRKNVIWLKGAPGPVTAESVFNDPSFVPSFIDSRGHYWQLNNVVLEFDGKKTIDHVEKNPYLFRKFQAYYDRRASRITEDRKGRIYIATQWGLLRKDGKSSWRVVGSKFNGMLGMSMWMWASNGEDTISFGGPWGASDYDIPSGKWRNSIQEGLDFPGTVAEFPGSMVEYAAADLQGRIWYGFYEAGAVCRESDGSLTHLTTRDGLANGSVWGIWADDDGTMWFNTFSGTSHFDPKQFVRRGE